MEIPLAPPFACLWQGKAAKGDITPPFDKGRLPACAKPLRRRQGRDFVRTVIFWELSK